MSIFNQLCPRLQENLRDQGWKDLRPIQIDAFPEISTGKNVLIIAPTAGGKTEAAFLPALNQFYGSTEDGVKILYVAPLRALLNNIEKRLTTSGICEAVDLVLFKWHGDVGRSKKLTTVKRGVDILLTTPESLDVILCSQYIDKKKFFSPLRTVIIDEAHYFAGSDRGAQLVSVLHRLELVLERDLQRVCLSATVGNPVEVLSWMCSPSKREQKVIQGNVGKVERCAELIYYSSDDIEFDVARSITSISKDVKSIIFEPSRKKAESRSKDFSERPTLCYVHHSSVHRDLREEAEEELSETDSKSTVIATCTLELGIDVGDLDLIQQEGDFPSVSSYIQRMGRTGRVRPPQRGHVHVTEDFDFLKNLAIMSLADEGYVEDNLLQNNFYHLILQQLIMLALGHNGFPIAKIEDTLLNTSVTSKISKLELIELLTHWIDIKLLRIIDGLILVGEEIERRYGSTNYRDLYVLFESPQMFEVWHGRSAIGTLDVLFVITQKEGFVFILAGRWWSVEEIDYEDGIVYVKPISTAPPPARWTSPRGHEISYDLAQQIKKLLLTTEIPPYLKQTDSQHFLSQLRREARAKGLGSSPFQLEATLDGRMILTNYAGDKVNSLIAALAEKISNWTAEDINYGSITFKTKDKTIITEVDMKVFLEKLHANNIINDPSLLVDIIEKKGIENSTKWNAWLPTPYRLKHLVEQIFDLSATYIWLSACHMRLS